MPRFRKPGSRTLVIGVLTAAVMAVCSIFAPVWVPRDSGFIAKAQQFVPASPIMAPPVVARPLSVADVLQSGVLIVVSKGSQQMHVFSDGSLWQTSPVSTGRRGHATPSGVFSILQKAAYHRSTTYSGAPMPYMQRLTWGGIAIHAGRLPGYPASHGCIRVPHPFARALYGLTRASRTMVVVTNQSLGSSEQARALALAIPPSPSPALPGSAPVMLAQANPARAPQIAADAVAAQPATFAPSVGPPSLRGNPQAPRPVQTIQLAAAGSAGEAEARWTQLVAARPELAGLQKTVIRAVVGLRLVYRLRASAPGAYSVCTGLKSKGVDCFNVT